MKKILNALGAGFLIITIGLAIFAPNMCIDWLAWCGGRIQALATAIGDKIPTDSGSAR